MKKIHGLTDAGNRNETRREELIENKVIAVVITLAMSIPYIFTINIFEL